MLLVSLVDLSCVSGLVDRAHAYKTSVKPYNGPGVDGDTQ